MVFFEKTEKIRDVLRRAINSDHIVDSTLRHQACEWEHREKVPFHLIKQLCVALRTDEEEEEEEEGPWVQDVCRGSRLVLDLPPARKRSPELLARLEKLQNEVDEAKYQKMVKSISHDDEEEQQFNLLPSFRLQLSFGAHVLVTMFVFYLIGSYATRVFSQKPAFQALGGVMGLTLGLILETTLFIVRSIPLKNLSYLESTSSKQKQA